MCQLLPTFGAVVEVEVEEIQLLAAVVVEPDMRR
jgi:hypothetical protein